MYVFVWHQRVRVWVCWGEVCVWLNSLLLSHINTLHFALMRVECLIGPQNSFNSNMWNVLLVCNVYLAASEAGPD